MKFTVKQLAVLRFIESELNRSGIVPSTREIQLHFGYASQTAAINHLKALEKKGAIQRISGRARSVTVSGRKQMRPVMEIPLMTKDFSTEPSAISFSPKLAGIQPDKDVFAVQIQGSQMESFHLLEGDLAIIERKAAKAGDLVLSRSNESLLLFQLVEQENHLYFQTGNVPNPRLIPAVESEILGVLVGVIRRI